MPYKFLEKVSIADVAFEASGKSLAGLFASAGMAITAAQIKNFKAIKPKTQKEIKIRADSREQLLFRFLDELIFIKDTEQLLFNKFKIKIEKKGMLYQLACSAQGEKLDTKRHQSLVDVKAITMHLFEVKKTAGSWKARVVLDV